MQKCHTIAHRFYICQNLIGPFNSANICHHCFCYVQRIDTITLESDFVISMWALVFHLIVIFTLYYFLIQNCKKMLPLLGLQTFYRILCTWQLHILQSACGILVDAETRCLLPKNEKITCVFTCRGICNGLRSICHFPSTNA